MSLDPGMSFDWEEENEILEMGMYLDKRTMWIGIHQ